MQCTTKTAWISDFSGGFALATSVARLVWTGMPITQLVSLLWVAMMLPTSQAEDLRTYWVVLVNEAGYPDPMGDAEAATAFW